MWTKIRKHGKKIAIIAGIVTVVAITAILIPPIGASIASLIGTVGYAALNVGVGVLGATVTIGGAIGAHENSVVTKYEILADENNNAHEEAVHEQQEANQTDQETAQIAGGYAVSQDGLSAVREGMTQLYQKLENLNRRIDQQSSTNSLNHSECMVSMFNISNKLDNKPDKVETSSPTFANDQKPQDSLESPQPGATIQRERRYFGNNNPQQQSQQLRQYGMFSPVLANDQKTQDNLESQQNEVIGSSNNPSGQVRQVRMPPPPSVKEPRFDAAFIRDQTRLLQTIYSNENNQKITKK